MNRREFLAAAGATSLISRIAPAAPLPMAGPAGEASARGGFDPEEKSVAELGAALESGATTSAALTQAYLARIAKLDRAGPALNSIIATNPRALAMAQALDAERQAGHLRGPLHGLPLLIKDNIETLDPLPTTAGSLALAQAYHDTDAPLIARLRAAGAVILGKTNLSEWANFRSAHSVSGWSAVGGQTLNPYATRFNPSGSSSGSAAAAAASLCAAAVGTETNGSILSPAARCGLVGFKPTVGRVSGVGVVPLSPRQDTAGPLARSTLDAAAVFEAMAEGGFENPPSRADLEAFRVQGLRIGVLAPAPQAHPEAARRWSEWYQPLKAEGAVLIEVEPPRSFTQMEDAEPIVLMWEFKAAINEYLRRLAGRVAARTLTDLIAFNRAHEPEEMSLFGQDIFEDADKLGAITTPAYRQARDHLMRLADTAGLARLFGQHKVDVLLALGGGPPEPIDSVWGDRSDGGWPAIASAAAVAGYPSLTVPAGMVRGLPVGAVFVAPRYQEGTLLRAGHAYERATRARRPPTYATG
jgi:amidase